MPGAGKTTLAARLTQDLAVPCLGKDQLKEFLMDTLGTPDLAWSRTIGGATFRMLRAFIDLMAEEGKTVMIECPFHAQLDRTWLAEIVDRHKVRCLELYCDVDQATRLKRFQDRFTEGGRHPGHFDAARDLEDEAVTRSKFAPLKLGDFMRVDTGAFGEAEYADLLAAVRTWLAA